MSPTWSGCTFPLEPTSGWQTGRHRSWACPHIISIIHTQRSLFFSHAHTRFVLCLRKGIYLWKRAISKTLRSAEWLKGAKWYNKKIRKKTTTENLSFLTNKCNCLQMVVCFLFLLKLNLQQVAPVLSVSVQSKTRTTFPRALGIFFVLRQ